MSEEEKPKEKKKLPINFMANEFMDQQLITLDKSKNQKEEKKMNGIQMMGESKESSWEEIVGRLKIQIANSEKELLLKKVQLKEAESHIKKE